MSRRPSSPPSDSHNYLRTLPSSSFLPAPTASSPALAPTPTGIRPSDLFARSNPPSDVSSAQFQWSDDAASTIAPDDSVSQIDRRFTGRRRMMGPRPMDDVPELPSMHEDEDEEEHEHERLHRDYVPPELLEDDRSTVVPPQQQGVRAVNPSATTAPPLGPLAKARGEGSSGSTGAVPYSSPRQYTNDEDGGDDGADHRPLVPGAAAPGRADASSRSGAGGVAPYSRPTGYAAVGRGDDDNDEDNYDDGGAYAAYSRQRDADLEAKAGLGGGEDDAAGGRRDASTGYAATGQTTLVGALSNPLGYFKSMRRGASNGQPTGSFYTPQELAFRPPSQHSASSFDPDYSHDSKPGYPPLQKLPSLDVAGRVDRSFPSPYSTGGGKGGGGGVDASRIQPRPLWQRWVWDTTERERRVWEHQRGRGMQRWPVVSWGLAVVMLGVMIYELVRMNTLTGSAIQTKPSINPMIGPSSQVLINLGARFPGCMKFVSGVTDQNFACLEASNKATLSSSDLSCTMSSICGFGGFSTTEGASDGPDQAFRFFVPIFLHVGVVHFLVNMIAQCLSSAMVERMMGSPRFLVLYLAAGIFGNVLGGNFALVGQPSVGASGAIFGTNAALLVDLLAHWKIEFRPKRTLAMLIIELIIGIGLGWVPGVDNFAHLGGFLVGLLGAIVLLPVIHPSRTHKIVFVVLRLIAFPLIIVVFVVLTRNFYTGDPEKACSWCRYLSCWPTSSNNHCKGTGLPQYTTTTSSSFYLPELATFLVSSFVLPLL
ncbi:hypothetical protein JCM11251_005158 [Rhodosporidiobolus azoricus]